MGLDPVTGPLLVLGLLGTAAAVGTSMHSAGQQDKAAKNAKADADKAAANQGIGNLSKEEAQASASKRAFKKGLIFTSPTGTLGSGSRGRSRLTGK